VVFWFSFDIKREQSALMKERSGPRGAHSHLTEKENLPRATSARTCSKKKPALRSGPRGAHSHLTKRKNLPRIGARRSLEIKKTSAR